MEEPDQVLLHYQMLEYLFRKCRLSTSCFSYAWNDFIKEYPEYQESLSQSNLKEIFWIEIAPNIEQYVLLDEKQAEYFSSDECILDLSDEDLLITLRNNEIRKDHDYIYWKSENQVEAISNQNISKRAISTMYKNPLICEKNSTLKINILEHTMPSELNIKKFDVMSLEESFLTNTDIESLRYDEVASRLKNSEINKESEHLGMFKNSLQKAMKNACKNTVAIPTHDVSEQRIDIQPLESTESATSIQSAMSLLVPNISRIHSTRSLTRSISMETPSTRSRRSALQSSQTASASSRMITIRKALIPDPVMNSKMSRFMERREKGNK